MFSTVAVGAATAGGVYAANSGKNDSADNQAEHNSDARETIVEMTEAVLIADIYIPPQPVNVCENGTVSDTAQELTADNYMRYS